MSCHVTVIRKLAGNGVWEDTYLARFSGGSDGSSRSRRSSSSSVAPNLHLPCGLPFLSCESPVVPVRNTVVR